MISPPESQKHAIGRGTATCLGIVLSGMICGCFTASRHAAADLDLAAHRVEQVQNQHATANESPDWTEWQNFLVFTNANIRIPLARAAVARYGADSHENYGFDPASLKLQWLKEGELLWISWTTVHRGSGGYTHDGHVILQVHANRPRELFRDCFQSIAQAGWRSKYYSALKISYDDDRTFTLSRRTTEINGDMGTPKRPSSLPFTTTFTNDDGEPGYISRVSTIESWRYKLAGTKLVFIDGTKAVDLDKEAQPLEEIVNGFGLSRATLERMNPVLNGQHKATGIVLINRQLKQYETASYDGLHGDK